MAFYVVIAKLTEFRGWRTRGAGGKNIVLELLPWYPTCVSVRSILNGVSCVSMNHLACSMQLRNISGPLKWSLVARNVER